jgi:glycine cleavage system H lipoate-binding protein
MTYGRFSLASNSAGSGPTFALFRRGSVYLLNNMEIIMVIAIVAFMFTLLITISYFLDKRNKAEEYVEIIQEKQAEPQIFIHPSHTFARIKNDSTVEIGLDDFAKRAFGKIDHIELPKIGDTLRQGDKLWKLTVGERFISQRMPVDGKITNVNEPQENWIVKVTPINLEQCLNNLISSSSVVTWLKKARTQFVAQYSGNVAPVLQDGGELIAGFARYLTDEQWEKFCKEFFNCSDCS